MSDKMDKKITLEGTEVPDVLYNYTINMWEEGTEKLTQGLSSLAFKKNSGDSQPRVMLPAFVILPPPPPELLS
jgi:hypothetical protein